MKTSLFFLLIAVFPTQIVSEFNAIPLLAVAKDGGLDIVSDEAQRRAMAKELLKGDGFDVPYEFVTVWQSYIAPENVSSDDPRAISRKQLSYHAEMLTALAQTSVEMFGVNWTMHDFCFKFPLPIPKNKESKEIIRVLDRTHPCTVISPLDCFLEGSFIQGPYPPVDIGYAASILGLNATGYEDWTTFDPPEFVGLAHDSVTASKVNIEDLDGTPRIVLEMFEKLGVSHGFAHHLCLDPQHPRCPSSTPNKGNDSFEFDVGSILGSGCKGIIQKFMQWDPQHFLDDFVQSSPGGPIESAQTVATTVLLGNASDIFDIFSSNPFYKPGFDKEAWDNEGVNGTVNLLSEWVEKSFAALDDVAKNIGIGGGQFQFDLGKSLEWINASKVFEKAAEAGIKFAEHLDEAVKDII